MFKFIHLTDFHLGSPGNLLWGLDPYALLDACLNDISTHHADARFCVITGDLTDSGQSGAYDWLKDRLDRFALKTFTMIGNHDSRPAYFAAFPDAMRDENGFAQGEYVCDAGVFLFLDTFRGETSAGAYCASRRAWLKDRLTVHGDKPVWVFMHHPPCDIGLPYMDRIKLEDAAAFADVIATHRNIRHIFFGHVHRAVYVCWHGIACTGLPGTSHQVPLVARSVATNYSDEPAMYGVVLASDDTTIVHFDAFAGRSSVAM